MALWDRSLSFLWLPCVGSLSSHFSLHPISGSLPSQAASCSLLGCIAPSLLVLPLGSWFTPGKCSISKRSSDFLKCSTCR